MVFKLAFRVLQITVSVFSKVFGSIKFGIFSGGNFQVFVSPKSAHIFCFANFFSNWLESLKLASIFSVKVLAGKRFHFAKSVFSGLRFIRSNQALKIGYIFSAKVFVNLVRAFLAGLFSLAK